MILSSNMIPPGPVKPTHTGWLALAVTHALALLASPATAQTFSFTHYTGADGLPQRQIRCVFQDHQGFMWFGTEGGVSRYDGAVFENFTVADGLPANRINAIGEDGNHRVIVATEAGATLFDGESFHLLKGTGIAEDEPVYAVLGEPQRGVWVVTDHGLYYRSVSEHDIHPTLYPDVRARSLMRDRAGRLWAGGRHGLFFRETDAFVQVTQGVDPSASISTIVEAGDGTVFLGTQSGIYQGGEYGFERLRDPILKTARAKLIHSGARDLNGQLWFGAWGGLVSILGDEMDLFTEKKGLPNSNIRSAFVDREGNLWLGSDDGVAKLSPGPFSSFTASNGLPGNTVTGLSEDRHGRIWVTTTSGVGVIDPNGSIWKLGARHGLPATVPTATAPLDDGSVLVGTARGLYRWNERILQHYTNRDGLPSVAIDALAGGSDGKVWIGLDSGLAVWSNNSIRTLPGGERLREANITAMVEDSEGDLWISTDRRGVYLYDTDAGMLSRPPGELHTGAVWSLSADRAGGIWLGTDGYGAYRYHEGQSIRFSTLQGLSNDFVRQILVDSDEAVWFYTHRGLNRLSATGRLTSYDAGDGLIDPEGSAAAALEDQRGWLWFGTGRGVVRYRPPRDQPPTAAPLVSLRAVTVNDEPTTLFGNKVVGTGRSKISFDFAGLSYRNETQTAFRYRLLGHEDAWSSPTPQRQISYASLPPGSYPFEVESRNDKSEWSASPARYRFTIEPAPHQTVDFRVVTAALALVLIAGLYWLRNRHLERERAKLGRLVETRTQELLVETHEKQRFSERIDFMQNHDPLTGLANRGWLRQQIESPDGPALRGCVLYIDLDRFSQINDAFGYSGGDHVLRVVGERLTSDLRSADALVPGGARVAPLVARMDGSEFVVVLANVAEVSVGESVARRLLDSIARPISSGRGEIVITASIGVSLLSEGRSGTEDIIRARAAARHAKRDGGGLLALFNVDMTGSTGDRLTLESHLRSAVERDELLLHYQPIVNLATGHMVSVEALVRWDSSHFGRVGPVVFIPIAEQTGLIGAIGEWTLDRACKDWRDWTKRGIRCPKLSINVSAHQLHQNDFVDHVRDIVDDKGLKPSSLQLELTESVLIERPEEASKKITALRQLGFGIAIDDFGTGYSSLSYLHRFPLDCLKVDRSFICRLAEGDRQRGLVDAVIAMSHCLRLTVVAEGVETQQQLAYLQSARCDAIQGYLIGRPRPADQIPELVGRPLVAAASPAHDRLPLAG